MYCFFHLIVEFIFIFILIHSVVTMYLIITYLATYAEGDNVPDYDYDLDFVILSYSIERFIATVIGMYCYLIEFFNYQNRRKFLTQIVNQPEEYHEYFFNQWIYLQGNENRVYFDVGFLNIIVRSIFLLFQTSILVYFNYLWYFYDPNFLGFQYFKIFYITFDFFNFSRVIPIYIGLDSLSLLMNILTCLICPLVLINSTKLLGFTYGTTNSVIFFFLIWLIQLVLLLAFSILDAFIFFILFEFILVPTFLIIIVFGTNNKKIRAAYYIVMYTLFTSVFFLISLIWVMFYGGSFSYFLFSFTFDLSSNFSKFIWFFMFISLICKVPTFPFFLWLPEAHVEAPTAGSVILAALLLKLGGYGIIRFLLPLFKFGTYYFIPCTYVLFIVSFLLSSAYAIESLDIKKVIAYSSIAHMNFALIGLFSGTIYGLQGSILFFIGHGFVSAALFFLIGFIYDRFKTRYIMYFGGLLFTMPIFSAFFLFFTLANMSFPGTVNFIAEFLIICSIFFSSKLTLVPVFILGLLTSMYSIWLYAKICLGPVTTSFFFSFDLTNSELCIILPLMILTFYFGLFPNGVLDCCFINLLYIY